MSSLAKKPIELIDPIEVPPQFNGLTLSEEEYLNFKGEENYSYEWDRGVLKAVMGYVDKREFFLVSRLIRKFQLYLGDYNLGEMLQEARIKIMTHSRYRLADIAYYTPHEMETLKKQDDYEPIPHLIIEIVSKNDTFWELMERIDDYFSIGVQVIWLINPYAKMIYLYEKENPQSIKVYTQKEQITNIKGLPDFSLVLKEVFG